MVFQVSQLKVRFYASHPHQAFAPRDALPAHKHQRFKNAMDVF